MVSSRPTFLLTVVVSTGLASQSASKLTYTRSSLAGLNIATRLPTAFDKPIQIDLPISHAGAFCYWIEYDGEGGTRVKGREGYFNIDPILRTKARAPIIAAGPEVAKNGGAVQSDYVNIPMDGLSILTYINKWLGPMSGWREYFEEASNRGYNMIHYPPLQERGSSDSPYSIRNQLVYDPGMFDAADKGELKKDGGRAKVEETLKIARDEYGLLSLTDVVLNHTADDTPWLADHPEAGKLTIHSFQLD